MTDKEMIAALAQALTDAVDWLEYTHGIADREMDTKDSRRVSEEIERLLAVLESVRAALRGTEGG